MFCFFNPLTICLWKRLSFSIQTAYAAFNAFVHYTRWRWRIVECSRPHWRISYKLRSTISSNKQQSNEMTKKYKFTISSIPSSDIAGYQCSWRLLLISSPPTDSHQLAIFRILNIMRRRRRWCLANPAKWFNETLMVTGQPVIAIAFERRHAISRFSPSLLCWLLIFVRCCTVFCGRSKKWLKNEMKRERIHFKSQMDYAVAFHVMMSLCIQSTN